MFAKTGDWLRGWLGAKAEDKEAVQRWIMLDVETSGLNPRTDQLLAIAAVAMRFFPANNRLELCVGDSFEVVLRQDKPSGRDNILIHHIGVQAQSGGCEPCEALELFRTWAGQSPMLAFHAAFDETMIKRAFQQFGLPELGNEWLDVEPVARLVGGNPRARALDDWLTHFGIECAVRHQAASDAFATAELLLRLWPAARKEARSWSELRKLARNAAWVPK